MNQPHDNDIILRDADGGWLLFRNPRKVLCAWTADEVLPVLEEAAASAGWSAGYVGYEAAPAFDSALPAATSRGALAWFGLYDEPVRIELPATGSLLTHWKTDTVPEQYFEQISKIKGYIAEGDSYQVNHTIRFHARVSDPWQFFLKHMTAARFSAYIQSGERAICSASPELFFELDGSSITCRPMKGTGRMAEALRRSPKDRAENIMIVDMIRNDLGQICVPGTIVADPLFSIEPVGAIWQMTSTVRGETAAEIPGIFKALFPCASITGAPKRRTMQIIQELESTPRGVYCGAIGYIAPQRKARFSVAIRTAEVDRTTGAAVYGAGGGVVWDSQPEAEWRECALKAEILSAGAGAASRCEGAIGSAHFQLLETMLFDNGIAFLDQHIERLADSAAGLGFRFNQEELLRELASVSGERQRLRLLLSRDGRITLESAPFPAQREPVRKVRFAREPVDPQNPWLYHKTTCRDLYLNASADFPDADDVLLWNRDGQVTESTIANLVVKVRGVLVTPPVACGLLPGTMRAALLKQGAVAERVVTREELCAAYEIYLINSLRGWMPAEIID